MKILRAGLFERVSTDEQSKFGYSIAAQKEALEEYCKNNKIKIVDHYCDSGVSGGISYKKRPEMMRLLSDVEAGKIDVILFTRLDRWFRNIKEYFKVQDILDKHGVGWVATQEDYSTETANGRMAITIFLAIAQNEREKTAERIKSVFDNKRKNKESFFGRCATPFGYAEEKDENGVTRLVKDPEIKDAMQRFWDIAIKYENVNKAAKMVNMEYGLNRNRNKWFELSKKEIYTGTYKGVVGYCPAYVSHEDWIKLNSRKTIKQTKGNRVYLFTGLIDCPVCGNKLASTYCKQERKDGSEKEYYSYRCQYKEGHTCEYKHTLSEAKIERWLLDNMRTLIENEIEVVEIERNKPKKKPKTNVAALKEKLRKLEIVYLASNKSDEEYLQEQKEINDAIKKAQDESTGNVKTADLELLIETLNKDFEAIYESFSREEKRMFWRRLIKNINLEGNKVASIDFN